MRGKTYGQLCPMARAMDVLGERWTLLVIRELLLGPKRFKELLAVLPAMGTNRLSDRLKALTEDGIVRQVQVPVSAYELTDLGEGLRKPVLGFGLWGLRLAVDERIDPATARAELVALSLTGLSNPDANKGAQALYEFHVGAEVFHIIVGNRDVLARSGPAPTPADIVVQCDLDTFMALALGQLTPAAALGTGRASLLAGQESAFVQAFKVLRYKP